MYLPNLKLCILYIQLSSYKKNMDLNFQFEIAFVFFDRRDARSDTEFVSRKILIIMNETKIKLFQIFFK